MQVNRKVKFFLILSFFLIFSFLVITFFFTSDLLNIKEMEAYLLKKGISYSKVEGNLFKGLTFKNFSYKDFFKAKKIFLWGTFEGIKLKVSNFEIKTPPLKISLQESRSFWSKIIKQGVFTGGKWEFIQDIKGEITPNKFFFKARGKVAKVLERIHNIWEIDLPFFLYSASGEILIEVSFKQKIGNMSVKFYLFPDTSISLQGYKLTENLEGKLEGNFYLQELKKLECQINGVRIYSEFSDNTKRVIAEGKLTDNVIFLVNKFLLEEQGLKLKRIGNFSIVTNFSKRFFLEKALFSNVQVVFKGKNLFLKKLYLTKRGQDDFYNVEGEGVNFSYKKSKFTCNFEGVTAHPLTFKNTFLNYKLFSSHFHSQTENFKAMGKMNIKGKLEWNGWSEFKLQGKARLQGEIVLQKEKYDLLEGDLLLRGKSFSFESTLISNQEKQMRFTFLGEISDLKKWLQDNRFKTFRVTLNSLPHPLSFYLRKYKLQGFYVGKKGEIYYRNFLVLKGSGFYTYSSHSHISQFCFEGKFYFPGWTEKAFFQGVYDIGKGTVQGEAFWGRTKVVFVYDVKSEKLLELKGTIRREDLEKWLKIPSFIREILQLPESMELYYRKKKQEIVFKSGEESIISLSLLFPLDIGKISINKKVFKSREFEILNDLLLTKNKGEIYLNPFSFKLKLYTFDTEFFLAQPLNLKNFIFSPVYENISLFIFGNTFDNAHGVLKLDLYKVKSSFLPLKFNISLEKVDISYFNKYNNFNVIDVNGFLDCNMSGEVLSFIPFQVNFFAQSNIYAPDRGDIFYVKVKKFNAEILKIIDPAYFSLIPFKSIYSEFTIDNKYNLNFKTIKAKGPVLNFLAQGLVNTKGELDFKMLLGISSKLSQGIKYKWFDRVKQLLIFKNNFIIEAGIRGDMKKPIFYPIITEKIFEKFINNIYITPQILIELLVNF